MRSYLVLSAALTSLLLSQTDAATGVLDGLISTVFDPTWNVENRAIIVGLIVVVLFLSGVGLPLPEDIPLTLAGFTTIKQANDVFVLSHFVAAFAVVTIPILLGDMVAYGLGRRFGFGLRERVHFIGRIITDSRLRRVQGWFDHYHSFAVFLGRQVAGVRFVTFYTAGTMRVPLGRFVFFDFLGCLVSVPVWLTLGVLASRYGEEWLHAAMQKVGGGFIVGTLIVLGLLVLMARLRKTPPHGMAASAVEPAVKVSSRADKVV